MKKILLLFVAIVQLTATYSQQINYEKTFDEAKNKAGREHKPIFIYLTNPTSKSVQPANTNFATGLDAKKIVDFYNKNFVCYTVSIEDTASVQIKKIVSVNVYPSFIFLDSGGYPVYKSSGIAILSKKYMDMAQQTLDRIASGNTIGHYQDLYKSGNFTAMQLKQYITLRQEMELYNNARFADEYVDLLPVKSLNDYNEVLFILKCGPYYNGKAYKLSHANSKRIDSIYKHEPSADRQAINNHIILNTRNRAIKTKNEKLARQLGAFIASTYGPDYRNGGKHSINNMLLYYYAVKDTNNYYRQAPYYFDTYYLNIGADSAQNLQKIFLKEIQTLAAKKTALANSQAKQDGKHFPVDMNVTAKVAAQPQNSEVANVLNNAAWNFYVLGTHNSQYLIKALMWCHKAIALQPQFSYYDTIAHIMYRLSFNDEAQLNQQKAIDMATAQFAPKEELDKLKGELEKIKEHQL